MGGVLANNRMKLTARRLYHRPAVARRSLSGWLGLPMQGRAAIGELEGDRCLAG